MGNCIGLNIQNYKLKRISSLLNLEGWDLIYKNNRYIYYNKFNKIEITDYPESISDYNDIYDFYNIEMLNSYETIMYLEDYLLKNNENIDYYDIDKINNFIYTIKEDNDINNDYDLYMFGLCTN